MKIVALALLVANVSSVSVSSSEKSLSHDTTLGDIAAAFNAACHHEDGKKLCDKSMAELFNPMAAQHARFCNSYCLLLARGQFHQSFLQNDLEGIGEKASQADQ